MNYRSMDRMELIGVILLYTLSGAALMAAIAITASLAVETAAVARGISMAARAHIKEWPLCVQDYGEPMNQPARPTSTPRTPNRVTTAPL